MNEAIETIKIRVTPDGRVNRNDAAAYIGKNPKTLAEWFRRGIGPKSHLVGGRRFYYMTDLEAFVGSQIPAEQLRAVDEAVELRGEDCASKYSPEEHVAELQATIKRKDWEIDHLKGQLSRLEMRFGARGARGNLWLDIPANP